jgi:glycosyltransferase involved in cell wall biosynthesis
MQSIVPLIFAKLFRLKYFFEVNDDPYRQLHHTGFRLLFRLKSKIAIKIDELNLRGCDKAFIITDEIRDKILGKNPRLNYEKLITLNSGANTKLLKPLNKYECCRKIGIDPCKNYVGFLGTIFNHSGLNVLISCAKQILCKVSDAEFLIFGDGPQKASLIEKAKRSGLDKKLKFFGQIDYPDIPVFLGATDICVAPFLATCDTNSSTKIFDYLSCGKPVVASNIENKENIFAESKTIYFVKPGDPNMLAEAIVHLLKNKKLANELGKKGRSFIVANYSREEIARKIATMADDIFSNLVN